MRAPVAATGWPRLQPLPFTLTISCGKPRIRLDATAIDANASLISTSSTSLGVEAGAGQRLRHCERRAEAGVGRRHPGRRPRPHGRERLEAVGGSRSRRRRGPSRTTASLMPDELPAVIENPGISGCSTGSAASFSSVVSRRGCSSTSKTRVSPFPDRDLDGEDLVAEPAFVGRRDRAHVRVVRPLVLLLAA